MLGTKGSLKAYDHRSVGRDMPFLKMHIASHFYNILINQCYQSVQGTIELRLRQLFQ